MQNFKSQYKNNLSNRLQLVAITGVICLLSFVIGAKSKELRIDQETYIEKEDNLSKMIAEEKQRRELLEEKKVYVTTKEYIKEVATEKLGLVDPDEIILKAREK